MSDLVKELATINPQCSKTPSNWSYEEAMENARTLYAKIRADTEPSAMFDSNVQDATYHAGIAVLPYGEIRLSNFKKLATITSEETFPPTLLAQLCAALKQHGYRYIPFNTFGEPFNTRQRFNGDLFNQLFDYI